MSNQSDAPLDLRPGWLKVSRSMQAQSCKQRGYAVVSINVIVDSNGNPIFWSEPNLTKIEPAASDALPRLMKYIINSS